MFHQFQKIHLLMKSADIKRVKMALLASPSKNHALKELLRFHQQASAQPETLSQADLPLHQSLRQKKPQLSMLQRLMLRRRKRRKRKRKQLLPKRKTKRMMYLQFQRIHLLMKSADIRRVKMALLASPLKNHASRPTPRFQQLANAQPEVNPQPDLPIHQQSRSRKPLQLMPQRLTVRRKKRKRKRKKLPLLKKMKRKKRKKTRKKKLRRKKRKAARKLRLRRMRRKKKLHHKRLVRRMPRRLFLRLKRSKRKFLRNQQKLRPISTKVKTASPTSQIGSTEPYTS